MDISTYHKIAILFPGQGAQTVGMLAQLAEKFAAVETIFSRASEVLGYDLWQLVKEGPEEKLNQTIHTQPALLVAEIVLWEIFQNKFQINPVFLAGHSLGEYTALVCGNALEFKTAVKLVAERARLMQEAVPEGKGGMLAIAGLDNNQIAQVCEEAAQKQILTAANYNALGQTVLAGELPAIERALILAQQQKAKIAKILPVSIPSHCPLMMPAATKLTSYIASITMKNPTINIVNNADVAIYNNAKDISNGLAKQLYSPVRWVETIQFFAQNSIDCFIECGPGKVLAGLNKRITADIPTISAEQLLLEV